MIHKLTIQEKGGTFHGLKYMQNKIITEINKIRQLYFGQELNSIYMSSSLFNIISDSSHFHVEMPSIGLDERHTMMGILAGMTVYIDISLNRNQIKLSLTKGQMRESKIDSILDDNNMSKIFEVIIEIDSDLI